MLQIRRPSTASTLAAPLAGEREVFGLLRHLFWTAAAAVLAVAVAAAVLFAVRHQSERWVRHTREVGRLARVAVTLTVERKIAGYGTPISSTATNGTQLPAVIDTLVALTGDNAGQHGRARAIRAEEPTGRNDSLLGHITEFLATEDSLYVQRVERDFKAELLSLIVMLISAAALGGVLWWMHGRIGGQASQLLHQQAQLEEQAIELEESTSEMEASGAQLQDTATELEMANEEMRGATAEANDARSRAEKATRELADAQRIAHIGSWECNIATGTNSWSDEMLQVLGRPNGGNASLDAFVQLVVDSDRPRIRSAVDRALNAGDPFSLECRVRWRDGTIRAVHARGDATLDDTGRPCRVIGTVQDVTERWRLQEQLQQSQKMEAVGQLAGGVAHDFNNVLTAIKSFSELIAVDLPADSPMRDDVREITIAADRAAALTRHLLAFSRQQMLQPVVLVPNGVVDGVTKMLARLIGVDVRCDTVLASDLGRVLADPGQLEQVLMNLAVNARDAMPNGGTLTIETTNVVLDARHATRLGGGEDVEPGEYVVLAVSDSGDGMSRETQARIFDPFFTTKEPGKGTGLGLSTVYGIVRQSGGFINVYSEIGRGTTFRIYLPRVEMDVRVQLAKPARAPHDGSETIMLVDDDDAVRAVASRILTRAGYRVLTASGPAEAEKNWKGHEGEIDLLMTDLMMPDMNGGELAERLLASRPLARVLYTSGYTSDTVVRRGLVVAEVAFLPKPFTIDAVLRKVREVLDG